jgi:pyridinium-3,5-bisthiocarboxylic acid mononucleotide nickel chelatase
MNDSAPVIAYLDCFSGISGDMLLGALVDAGLPPDFLLQQLHRLPLTGFSVKVEEVRQGALRGAKLHVVVENEQPPRSWQGIRAMLTESDLPEGVRTRALAVFSALAAAEAEVHGCSVEEVHFHEVGAVDAMVDIVGVCIGLEHLGISELVVSPLPLARGWVSCDHGLLPLPAPAVCLLLDGVPVHGDDSSLELVTPTGAALVKSLADRFGPFPAMTIKKVAYGAGSHQLPNGRPNLLRLILGRRASIRESQEVEVIETHLDDWSPEGYPYLSDRLFSLGALDVAVSSLQMKKGRPGLLLRVVAVPETAWELKRCLLTETTAIGLRFRRESRWTLPRASGTIPTRWGLVKVKKVETPAGARLRPEYEDCRRLAQEQRLPLADIYAEVARQDPADFQQDPQSPAAGYDAT